MKDARYNIVFIGRSGCGKGTQADLLKNLLEKKSGSGSVLYVNTGTCFRELTRHTEFLTARLLQDKILIPGEKAPDGLAVWAVTNELIYGASADNHIIVDGSPRTALEAAVLDEMFDFLDRHNVFHIYLNTSAEWVFDRMMGRGRADDNPENIKRRLAYYEKQVIPAIAYYRKDSAHRFIEINGEQPVESVYQDIMRAIGL